MNTVILDLIDPKPGLPPYLRPNALAYYDLRNMPSVSLPLTSLVTNGDFADTTGWTAVNATGAAASNTYSCTGNGTAAAPSFNNAAYSFLKDRVIYMRGKIRVTNANCTTMKIRSAAG